MKINKFIALFLFGGVCITKAQVLPAYVPTSSLVAWYSFTGNANDESGNANNATYTGTGVTLSTDRFGNAGRAYDFAGNTGDYIRMPADNFPTGDRTISMWFNVPTVSNRPMLLGYGGGGYLGYGTSFLSGLNVMGNASYHTQSHYLSNALSYAYPADPVNQWIHWVITINGSVIEMYINGVATSSNTAFQYNTITTGKDFVLGVMPDANGVAPYTDANGGYLQGKLDDIGVWNRALSASEILQLYQACAPAISSQPSSVSQNVGTNAQFVIGSNDMSATFQWQNNSTGNFQNLTNAGQFSGVTTKTLTVSNLTLLNNAVLYKCVVTTGTCVENSSLVNLQVNNVAGIFENFASKYSVCPNPAENFIEIKIDNLLLNASYQLTNVYGATLKNGKLNESLTSIDMSELTGGIYFLKIREQKEIIYKIIKN